MRYVIFCLAAVSLIAQTTDSADPKWRQMFGGLPDHPGPNMSVQEIDLLRGECTTGRAVLRHAHAGRLRSESRTGVRRMWTYLAGMEMMARSPQMRAAMGRARQAMLGLRGGFLMVGPQSMAGPQSSGQMPAQEQPLQPQKPYAPSFRAASPRNRQRS